MTSHSPYVRSRRRTRLFNNLGCHYKLLDGRPRERVGIHTPVWTTNDSVVPYRSCSSATRNAEVCKLDTPVLVCQDIRTLDVSVYDTLVVKIYKSLQDLRNVDPDEGLWELAKFLADIMERSVLAKPVPDSCEPNLRTGERETHSRIMYR